MIRYLKTILAAGILLCGSPMASHAELPAHMAGVSFSPAVIDFGHIPMGEEPTQLLRLSFDRPAFMLEHLPTLRRQGSNGPNLALFSRSVTPDAITLVYRIMVPNDGQDGPFQFRLVLVKEGAGLTDDASVKSVVDSGVLVQGEKVQGLQGGRTIDFGPVRYGKGAVKEFELGFYHSNITVGNPPATKPQKSDFWSAFRSLSSMTVSSTSPYFTAINRKGFGLNASAWVTWQVLLSTKAPQKKLQAELTFQTGDGYSLTVPVSADLSGPGYPIPPWEPTKLRKH